MREIVTKLYEFEELTEEAKEKALERCRELFLEWRAEENFFEKNILDELAQWFPNSDWKVQYSLSYGQGVGLNIYGIMHLLDFKDVVAKSWTEERSKDLKTVLHYLEKVDGDFELTRNDRYGYSCKFMDMKDAECHGWGCEDTLRDEWWYKNVKEGLIGEYIQTCLKHLERLEVGYEKAGYEHFYEITKGEIIDGILGNEFEFEQDGTLFIS